MDRAKPSWRAKCVLIVLWLNFVALWVRVYQISTFEDVTDSINYLGLLISVYGLLVAWWIFHNIRIYRKKGPRRAARLVPFAATSDSLRRYIQVKADLKQGKEIFVDIVDDQKVFFQASESPRQPNP